MKTRYGHVSNSSSSSFIIGMAEIVDKKLLKKAFEDAGIDISTHYEIFIRRSTEMLNEDYYSSIQTKEVNDETQVILSSFTGSAVTQTLGPSSDLKVACLDDSLNKEWLIVDYTGDEGDDCFNDGYDYGYDYDIDESFFSHSVFEHVLNWLKEPEKFGLKQAKYRIGAGRNG